MTATATSTTPWFERHEPLARGHHGLPAVAVRHHQRGRVLAAAATLGAQHGLDGVTATRLASRAGVSRTTFYELFEGKDECFRIAADEAREHLLERLAEAAAGGSPPRERFEAIVDAFMRFCADYPHAARLLVLGAPATGEDGAVLRSRGFEEMVELLREPLADGYPEAPALSAEMIAGGLWQVAAKRILAERAHELPLVGRTLRRDCWGRLPARPAAA